jgi:aryl-alcohol dehydrogenase-like predicted oxidoreductase
MPENSRLALFDRFVRYTNDTSIAATEAYVSLAREHDLDPAQMALAFVNRQTFTSSNIIGATTMEQLKSNIASIDIELSKDVLSGIAEIHGRYSNPSP